MRITIARQNLPAILLQPMTGFRLRPRWSQSPVTVLRILRAAQVEVKPEESGPDSKNCSRIYSVLMPRAATTGVRLRMKVQARIAHGQGPRTSPLANDRLAASNESAGTDRPRAGAPNQLTCQRPALQRRTKAPAWERQPKWLPRNGMLANESIAGASDGQQARDKSLSANDGSPCNN